MLNVYINYKFLHFHFKYLFKSFSVLGSRKCLESCVLEEKDLHFQWSGQTWDGSPIWKPTWELLCPILPLEQQIAHENVEHRVNERKECESDIMWGSPKDYRWALLLNGCGDSFLFLQLLSKLIWPVLG